MKVMILGGGTVFHIRPHLALCAPAYGQAAWQLDELCRETKWKACGQYQPDVVTHVTKMAGGRYLNPDGSGWMMDTNEDIAKFIDEVILPDPDVKVLFMSAALCDFDVRAIRSENYWAAPPTDIGKMHPRLSSQFEHDLSLVPATKIISRIRKTRKDIFLVGFKTTTNATPDEQFEAGLKLLKQSSCNLVLANDLVTRLNMTITPEQARYHVTTDRVEALRGLVEITAARANDTFTRSTVVPGDMVPWNSEVVPEALRTVVNHLVARGAYKPFLGATVGHFAARIGDNKFLTSVRKTDYNKLGDTVGLVVVESSGLSDVIAHGAKPSVGGMSQRTVFANHPGYDCIAHAHVQIKPGSKVPISPQWTQECGSHRCGEATSSGLIEFDGIKAVFLEKHGFNVVFNRNIDPQRVVQFLEANFDLDHQTSELA